MRICEKKGCNNEVPYWIKIDGEKKNLGNRKYCLECSTYKGHNTRNLNDDSRNKICVCSQCERTYIYNRRKGYRLKKCNSCLTKNKRNKLKKRALEYLGNECKNCGYNRCIQALEFHHLDPATKDFSFSDHYYKKWEEMKVELKKCVLLCCRCHREVESGYETIV